MLESGFVQLLRAKLPFLTDPGPSAVRVRGLSVKCRRLT